MSETYEKDKMVPIEPLPEKQRKVGFVGRKPLSDEEKAQRRIAKGLNPMKDIVNMTPARKKALEKARIVRDLKREYRNTEDDNRKKMLAVQINALANKPMVEPLANKDLKEKIKYQNPTYKEEGLPDYVLDHNATLKNLDQPEYADKILQWSNSQERQKIWSSKLDVLESKMNNLDNYLSKIRVLSGEGTASDYANPSNVRQNHYIQPHNQNITPQHGPTDPSPFVAKPSFRSLVMKKRA
jgi:hypothetical protein